MHKSGQITTVIKDEVQLLAVSECGKLLFKAPIIFLLGLAFPRKTVPVRSEPREVRRDCSYTGVPDAAIAAAAWSWVEKMLQLDQVTSAPRDVKVSMRTAVWIAGTVDQPSAQRLVILDRLLICRHPAMRAPFKGWSASYFSRMAIRPGISISANSISRRPNAASD